MQHGGPFARSIATVIKGMGWPRVFSPGGAKDLSPRREPWVANVADTTSPGGA
jgi:hypothetical protein